MNRAVGLTWEALQLSPAALILAVATLAAVAAALGVSWLFMQRARRARHDLADVADRLQAAQAHIAGLEPLTDLWLWRSDAAHRLVALRPPKDAPAAAPEAVSINPAPAPLGERFEPRDAAALQGVLARAAAFDDLEVKLIAETPRFGLLSGRPWADSAGAFAGYHGVFRETVTESGSLAAGKTMVSDHESFSYTVSHDLRAPIRVVEGFTKIVKEDYGQLLDRVGNDHLDRVLGAATRMNNMIDALLALSKLSSQPLARQPVDLSLLGQHVVDDLKRQSPGRSVEVTIELGMQVQGDATLLRVAIENLLGNAWKYTGKVAHPMIVFTRHASVADTFTVRDNGAGFDMRFADRLFGVFQRLHGASDFPGTGIGLASVRRIVRRHGGEIHGEAEVGRGASFHFSLPPGGEAASGAG